MAYRQKGNTDRARHWYGKAVNWMATNHPDDELRRFSAEAAALLGIADEPKPTSKKEENPQDHRSREGRAQRRARTVKKLSGRCGSNWAAGARDGVAGRSRLLHTDPENIGTIPHPTSIPLAGFGSDFS